MIEAHGFGVRQNNHARKISLVEISSSVRLHSKLKQKPTLEAPKATAIAISTAARAINHVQGGSTPLTERVNQAGIIRPRPIECQSGKSKYVVNRISGVKAEHGAAHYTYGNN